jgi:energy-coupling factor transport system ATP-binding protein
MALVDFKDISILASNMPILENASFSLNAGGSAVILGENGAGKSVFLTEIAKKLSAEKNIGYVGQSQSAKTLTNTVRSEIAFNLEERGTDPNQIRRRIAEIAIAFDIIDILDKKNTALSIGQKQLVALAAAVSTYPEILILDEPLGCLDPVHKHRFVSLLALLKNEHNIAIILAENNISYLEKEPGFVDAYYKISGKMLKTVPKNEINEATRNPNRPLKAAGLYCDVATETEIVLKTHKLSYCYTKDKKEKKAVLDVSLDIKKGSINAIVGPNGSGKSTLLYLLSDCFKPTGGWKKMEKTGKVSHLIQNARLIFNKQTLMQTLVELLNEGEEYLLEKAGHLGIGECLYKSPDTVSAGEIRLAAIFLASSLSTDILILDEPTTDLDTKNVCLLEEYLTDLRNKTGMTIIFASHNLRFASNIADYVHMMFDGELIASEDSEAFFKNNIFYKELA